ADADRVPQGVAAVAVLRADLGDARVAARRQLGAGRAVGVRAASAAATAATAAGAAATTAAATAAAAAALAADRVDLADADRVPRRRAAVAVLRADLGRARIAARRQLAARRADRM